MIVVDIVNYSYILGKFVKFCLGEGGRIIGGRGVDSIRSIWFTELIK